MYVRTKAKVTLILNTPAVTLPALSVFNHLSPKENWKGNKWPIIQPVRKNQKWSDSIRNCAKLLAPARKVRSWDL